VGACTPDTLRKRPQYRKSKGRPVCIIMGMAKVMSAYGPRAFWLCLVAALCGIPALAQSSQDPASPSSQVASVDLSEVRKLPADPQSLATINGTVVDQSGAAIPSAQVKLTREDASLNQEIQTDENGQFFFTNLVPGQFQLVISAEGFATKVLSGAVQPGETSLVPPVTLILTATSTEVRVVLSPTEIAADQIKVEEKQRVLGVIPNFYVSYIPNAVPLNSKQKFQLAWKSTVDPVSFGITGAVAGIQQAQNDFNGYGQGFWGYARRYGASYGTFIASTYVGSAILPSILKQDPRYFYKGTGTKRSRVLYALANAVICKGDNGHWEPNYSGIIGSLAAGGISNLYYPAQNRDGLELTFENALIGIGESAAVNILQEFVIRRLTPTARNIDPSAN
jgi:hypothetical protein